MKLIVIAGMYRSGSTLLFNMARLIVEQAGKTAYCCGLHDYDVHGSEGCVDYHIVKAHKFDQELADRADFIYMSFRPVDEIIDSLGRWLEREPDMKVFKHIEELIVKFDHERNHEKWLMHFHDSGILGFNYSLEYISTMKQPTIDLIWSQIFKPEMVNLDFLMTEKIIDQLPKPPTDKNYDPETMLFKHHIS